jgi:hypothetical protein
VQLSLLILFVLVPYCLGHGWVVEPIPSGFVTVNDQNSASQTAPCGNQPYTFQPPTLLTQNATVDVKYVLGAGHTGVTCRIAYAKTPSTTSFDKQILADNIPCSNVGNFNDYNVSLSQIPTAGLYYIQWIWTAQGSTWYSCFQVAIVDPNVHVSPLTYGGSEYFEETLEPFIPANYSIAIPPGAIQVNTLTGLTQQYLLIKINNTINSISPINATASSSFIPASYQDGYYTTNYPGQVTYINLCSVKTNYAYVSIFGDNYGNYSYSISNNLYNSWLDWAGIKEQPIALDGAGFLVYYTQATSTLDVPKRIRLDGRGSNAYLMYYGSCNADYKLPFNPVSCYDVLDQIQNGQNNDNGRKTQYYYVVTDGPWYGKIMIEGGKCSSATSVFVSLFLAFIVLLF